MKLCSRLADTGFCAKSHTCMSVGAAWEYRQWFLFAAGPVIMSIEEKMEADGRSIYVGNVCTIIFIPTWLPAIFMYFVAFICRM